MLASAKLCQCCRAISIQTAGLRKCLACSHWIKRVGRSDPDDAWSAVDKKGPTTLFLGWQKQRDDDKFILVNHWNNGKNYKSHGNLTVVHISYALESYMC